MPKNKILLIIMLSLNCLVSLPIQTKPDVPKVLELYGIRAVQVDLDLIYSPSPLEFRDNVRHTLDRLVSIGANTIFLQVFQDPDGDGSANGVYFKTDSAPSLDVLGVFLDEAKRRNFRVFAWMTTLACSWILREHPDWEILAYDPETGNYVGGKYWYRRASPFCEDFVDYVTELFEDLSSYPLDGILLQDDLYLGEWEDFSVWAMKAFRKEFGMELTPSLLKIQSWREKWIKWKAERLMYLARKLENLFKKRRPGTIFSIDVYSDVLLFENATSWIGQDRQLLADSDFFMVIMAYPFLEDADDPKEWVKKVAKEAVNAFGDGRVLIKIQSYDWKEESWISSEELSSIMEATYEGGAINVGYYPEDPFSGFPKAQVIRSAFLASGSVPKWPINVLILSNSIDLPAARELAINIGRYGVSITLTGEEAGSLKDVIIVLGGPKAYEGIGKISKSCLPTPQSEKLISKEGSMVTVVSRKGEIEYVVIAGHTRVETAKAASEFPSTWIRLTALSNYILGCDQVILGPVVYSYQGVGYEDLAEVNATVLIVDPDDSGLTNEEITRLHIQGKTVIAYLNIGQAERFRSYWKKEWEINPPSWLGEEDAEWPENYWVSFWNQEWKGIILNCLDEIIERGFDGVLLDRIDVYEYWENRGVLDAKKMMIDLVLEISLVAKQNKCFLIIPQNSEELIEDPNYLDAIDGVSSEDVWTTGDKIRPSHEVEPRLELLDEIISKGKIVLVLDYPSSLTLRKEFCSKAKERGYLPYSSSPDLQGIDYEFLKECWGP